MVFTFRQTHDNTGGEGNNESLHIHTYLREIGKGEGGRCYAFNKRTMVFGMGQRVFGVQVWVLIRVSYDGVKFHEIKNSEIYLTHEIYERRVKVSSVPSTGKRPTIFPYLRANNYAFYEL